MTVGVESATTENQPQESTQTQESVGNHAAFLGTEPELDFNSETESPESSTEAEASEETVADSEAEVETESAEAQAEQPPSVEERLKDLTPRQTEEYQSRYPNAWKALVSPDTPEDMKHLLLDKIDTDQEFARLQAQLEEGQEEPTLEEPTEQPTEAGTPQTPQQVREAYYQRVDNLVQQVTDPEARKQIGIDLLKGFGVQIDRVNDPKLSPRDRAELQALVNNAPQVGTMLAKYAVDLINTVLPIMLPEAMEYSHPGYSKDYERSMYRSQWEGVKGQTDAQGNPLYANLPEYGTKEFREASRKAAEQIPGFNDMIFKGGNGQPLPQAEQAKMKYNLLAKIMNGERVPPAVVAQAVATGKKLAGQADKKRAAGRALGAGQPTGKTFTKAGGAEDDPVMAALDAELARTNNDIRPVSRYTQAR